MVTTLEFKNGLKFIIHEYYVHIITDNRSQTLSIDTFIELVEKALKEKPCKRSK